MADLAAQVVAELEDRLRPRAESSPCNYCCRASDRAGDRSDPRRGPSRRQGRARGAARVVEGTSRGAPPSATRPLPYAAVLESVADVALLDRSMPGMNRMDSSASHRHGRREQGWVTSPPGRPRDDPARDLRHGALGSCSSRLAFRRPARRSPAASPGRRSARPQGRPAARRSAPGRRPPQFRGRALEVLELVAEGLPAERIAMRLEVGEKR